MAIYLYRCDKCKKEEESSVAANLLIGPCDVKCAGTMKRVWQFGIDTSSLRSSH